jgi:Na+/H+ antiporter NhaD/arsenite permease-like protein
MGFLDDVPLATLTFIAGLVVIVVAMVNNDLSVDDALKAVGALGLGSGGIGLARSSAGRGLKK